MHLRFFSLVTLMAEMVAAEMVAAEMVAVMVAAEMAAEIWFAGVCTHG